MSFYHHNKTAISVCAKGAIIKSVVACAWSVHFFPEGHLELLDEVVKVVNLLAQALDFFLSIGVEAAEVLVLGEEFIVIHHGEFSGDYTSKEVGDAVAVDGDVVDVAVSVLVCGDFTVTENVFGIDEAFVVVDGFSGQNPGYVPVRNAHFLKSVDDAGDVFGYGHHLLCLSRCYSVP